MNQLPLRFCALLLLYLSPMKDAGAFIMQEPPLFGAREHGEHKHKNNDEIRHIVASGLTKPLPIFSHATIYQGLIHVSCIQGFVPGTFEFPSPDAKAQAQQVLQNLKTVLEQAGSSLDRVLKLTIFFTDMQKDFAAVNEMINRYFPENPPARSSIGVAELPRNAKVVMECTAAIPSKP